jgi:hypothetical protein
MSARGPIAAVTQNSVFTKLPGPLLELSESALLRGNSIRLDATAKDHWIDFLKSLTTVLDAPTSNGYPSDLLKH